MPAESHVRIGGQWRKIPTDGVYVRVGGIWKQVDFGYSKVSGTWQQVYIRDTTGPSAPSGAQAKWGYITGGVPCLAITWTNPVDSDYASMSVSVWPGFGNPFIYSIPSAAQAFNFTDYVIDNSIYTVQLTPYDANGNPGTPVTVYSMGFTGAARGRSQSPAYIYPIDSGTFRFNIGEANGFWRTDAEVLAVPQGGYRRAMQGWDAGGVNLGAYFYGTQFYDGYRGANFGDSVVEMYRVNQGGTPYPVPVKLFISQVATSKAIGADDLGDLGLFDGPHNSPGMSLNGITSPFLQIPVTSDWFDNMSDGSLRSMWMYSDDTVLHPDAGNASYDFGKWYGAGEVTGSVSPGCFIVTHTG